MLRTGCALLTALVLAASASAQGPGTKFAAVIGGATLSDIDNFPVVEDDRWGATAGALVGINAGRTAATLEALWIQKGGGETRLDYIELPLTLGAIVAPEGKTYRLRLYSGISVGFKVSCSSDLLDCDNAKGTEWGWPIGFQIAKVTNSASFFGIDVRYTFPLSDAFEFAEAHNRVWAFRLMFGKQIGTQ
jgi:hypothetical protein